MSVRNNLVALRVESEKNIKQAGESERLKSSKIEHFSISMNEERGPSIY